VTVTARPTGVHVFDETVMSAQLMLNFSREGGNMIAMVWRRSRPVSLMLKDPSLTFAFAVMAE
jgi:hypothetical protein